MISGDAWLVGSNGLVVTRDTDGSIRFDAIGDPLFLRSLCEPLTPSTLFVTPQVLKTINGLPPDDDGNFNISVGANLAEDNILRIVPTPTDTGYALSISLVGKSTGA